MTSMRDTDAANRVGQATADSKTLGFHQWKRFHPAYLGPVLIYPPHSPGGSRPERDKIDSRLQKSTRNGTFWNLERTLSHSGRSTPALVDTTNPTPIPYDLSFGPSDDRAAQDGPKIRCKRLQSG